MSAIFDRKTWGEITDRGTSGDQVFDILESWDADVAALRAELDAKNQIIKDLIDLAQEGLSYTPPYFREKWGMDGSMKDILDSLKEYEAHPKEEA
jgi:hypothetical protein